VGSEACVDVGKEGGREMRECSPDVPSLGVAGAVIIGLTSQTSHGSSKQAGRPRSGEAAADRPPCFFSNCISSRSRNCCNKSSSWSSRMSSTSMPCPRTAPVDVLETILCRSWQNSCVEQVEGNGSRTKGSSVLSDAARS